MAKKKKVRVALKKNRQKRTRANDLTRTYEGGPAGPGPEAAPGPDEAATQERVRAKGDLSRYRTILTEEADDPGRAKAGGAAEGAASLRAVDESTSLRGRVVRVHGLVSIVEADGGGTFPCHVRRLLKSLAIDGRNVVAVGDRVWFRPAGRPGEDGLIEKVEPRGGVINRGYRNRRHVIAANVDTVLIVASMAEPPLKLGLVDRYLVAAETGGVRPVIVLNKADLVDLAPFQWIVGLYTQLGYETILTSALGRGIDRLRELMASGVTAVSGQSGVGKSSLLNAIQPGLNLKVREVSDWTSKGKHTTTAAELIRLEAGGYVMDTPGLRQFELWGAPPAELEGHFVEFRPYIPLCRFPDCTHTHEGRCAVKDAVHWGQIHLGRYESYRRLFEQRPLDVE
ncbi:Putative ribosome biogenesis GTPase RsgA [Aquisphaera giovannonii]|uniref:Small ribosomal subunit biogenesis GTPase RsgA n=1 Tax=Aquisphaera giovannonii TaxID=406548 RepID=A0A5B9W1V3_9BACT|nr:ribosome small subunit-dependent GTPase A [Aquisphaera giovannonii]QEH34237.1 Putative ribosome biogenesis GTPase RsgA [Aquisphaera giovannonii]